MHRQNPNEVTFFYEICNFWQSQNLVQKNLQLFFIFSHNKNETYFKVPSLSFKIKTKSDFDNTEVKLWASFDVISDIIDNIKLYLSNNKNNMIHLAGHKYTFFLSQYPSSDEIHYTTIKLTDSNNTTNDFVLKTYTLSTVLKTLEKAYENIIKISLDFITVAQNNEILSKLTELNNNIIKFKTTPESIASIQSVNNSFDMGVSTETNEPISDLPIIEPSNDINVSKDNENLQLKFETAIKDTINKSPVDKLKEKIIKALKLASNPFAALNGVLESYSLLCGKDINTCTISKYFSLTNTSFECYFKKLAFITNLHKSIKTKVPLFTIKVRYDKAYIEDTKLLNETLFNLYVEYKFKESKTADDENIYAHLRYILAPFWSSYIAVANEDFSESNFFIQIKQIIYHTMQTWDKTYKEQIDKFIFDNGLAYDTSDGIVDKFFGMHCPTLYQCVNDINDLKAIEAVDNIIAQLKETFSYQRIILPTAFDLNCLTDTFLRAVKIFSDNLKINNETDVSILNTEFTRVYDLDIKNIRNEFKALQSLDAYDMKIAQNEDDESTSVSEEFSKKDTKNIANNSIDPLELLV